MKIAVWHNLPSGGGKRALADHVKGLVARGHTVEIWSPPTADRSFLPLKRYAKEHTIALQQPISNRFGRSPLPSLPVVLDRIWASRRHARAVAHAIAGRSFDVLLSGSCMFLRAGPIGRFVDIPSVHYQGEPYRWLYEALPRLPWAAIEAPSGGISHRLQAHLRDTLDVRGWRLQAREELVNSRAFTQILVNSRYSRERILQSYGIDATVCYLGVDTDRFAPRGVARQDLVLGLGAVVPEKNLEFVIRSVALMDRPLPRLVWVGNVADTDYADRMHRLAQSLGVPLDYRIRTSDDEVLELLNAAFALAYAPRLEPFGLAPLEAAACGLPVVGVAEAGVRESIKEGVSGFLVDSVPHAMAGALQRIRGDRLLAQDMSRRARTLMLTEWSLPAAVDRLEKHLLAAGTGGAGS